MNTRMRGSIVISIAMAACGRTPPPHQAGVPVRIATATRMSAPVAITSNGVAEPLEAVAVEAQVSGTLVEVAFREGDDVKAGQTLFRIDPRPFEAMLRQAEATLARDEAQAASAARDAERYQALVAKDYVTKSAADQATATAVALRATLRADSAAVESARLNVEHCTVRSPIAGRTGSLLVRQGNLVKLNGGALVVVNQITPILVRFPVTQREFLALSARTRRGPVDVNVSTADSVPLAERGTLTFIDNAVDSLTGTVSAKARFDNGARRLWPGEYVRVSVQLEVVPNVLVVPTAALQMGQSGPYVFVIDTTGHAQMRPVTPGMGVGEFTGIEDGLADGERVVIDGQSRLVPGAAVDIQAPVGGDSSAAARR